jgi:hypothetical protein
MKGIKRKWEAEVNFQPDLLPLTSKLQTPRKHLGPTYHMLLAGEKMDFCKQFSAVL